MKMFWIIAVLVVVGIIGKVWYDQAAWQASQRAQEFHIATLEAENDQLDRQMEADKQLACSVLGYDNCAHYSLCLLEKRRESKWSAKCEYERRTIKQAVDRAQKKSDAEFHEVK